jgi:hypothetical protein
MADTTLPLDDLTRQIAERESELERLRHEYDARQARLADLTRRREELQDQLQQVQAEIQAVSRGSAADMTAAPATTMPAASPTATEAPLRLTLADALLEAAREAGRPLTARELGEALVRRRFPTTSGNITALVQNRLTGLLKEGVFRRAEGQPGFVLGTAATATSPAATTPGNGAAAAPAKKGAPAKAVAGKTAPAKRAAASSQAGWRRGQPPLHAVLTELLQKARKPVGARELAEQVLATGYKTKSKNFSDVVWTALGQLKEVENVKGQGWRLKKA